MVKEYENKPAECKYFISEQVDCKDEHGAWLNAEVTEIAQNKVKVHFSNFSNKFDRWLDVDSDNIQKQWRYGSDFNINNRIDVLDTYNMWKEAHIIDINDSQIKIHYKGYTARYDEWLHKTSDRIKEIGSKSTALGIGRTDPSNASRYSKKEIQPEIKKLEYTGDKETQFRQLLSLKDFVIQPVEGDGNCLFRSVSHQLYSTTSFHDIIRATAMKYISIERNYFSQFIVGGLEKVDEYLEHQSRNGAWGDDIEIQAMSEIYNKPFEIYAYSNTPMRTFHENSGIGCPLRLAYHGQSHYNSIVNKDKHEPLIKTTPGEFESEIIEKARRGELIDLNAGARMLFENSMQMNIDDALIRNTDQTHSEDELLRFVIEESKNTEIENVVYQSMNEESEAEMIRHVIEMSKNDMVSNAVIDVVNSGFTMEQAMEAWHIVGDDTNLMIEYIFNNIL